MRSQSTRTPTGGLGALWWIARSAIGELQQGRSGGRSFHMHAGYYMATLLAALDSRPVSREDSLAPDMTAEAWLRSAFHEAVKCAPTGNRSKPSEAMCA